MAVTRIVGTKWVKAETIEGGVDASANGQIKTKSVYAYNIVDGTIIPVLMDSTGDYTFNKVTTTSDVAVGGALSGTTFAFTGAGSVDGAVTLNDNLTVVGDLQVKGTTTSVESTTLDVADKNITIAKGGTLSTMNGSGLTVEATDGTNGSFVYDDTLASKWKLGEEGTEKEVIDASSVQVLTNKDVMLVDGVISVDGTDYTEIENALRALSSVAGSVNQTLEGDTASAEYDDANKKITVSNASTITGLYLSGLRMKTTDDYTTTVSGSNIEIILIENLTGNFVVDFK